MYVTLKLTLGPICHWIYASQYTKAYWLTQGIIKKACLLCYQHHKLLESSSLRQLASSLQYHEIETELKTQKARSKMIKRIFLVVDISLMILIVCVQRFLCYAFASTVVGGGDFYFTSFLIRLFPPFLEAIFSLVLVASAIMLVRSVRKYTQKK